MLACKLGLVFLKRIEFNFNALYKNLLLLLCDKSLPVSERFVYAAVSSSKREKNQLTINHEFIEEAKTTVAR